MGLLEQQGSLGVMVPLGVLVPLVPLDLLASGGVRVTGESQADRVSLDPWDHLEPLDHKARQEQLGHLVCKLSYKLCSFISQQSHNIITSRATGSGIRISGASARGPVYGMREVLQHWGIFI